MALPSFIYELTINLKNIPGWRTSRKIVVIECDDWGGIRIPSVEVYERLNKQGIKVPDGHFRYDTLESKQDLEALFQVLDSVKDLNGRSAVMSPATNVANPDFSRTRASGFREYHYEKFTDTLLRYGRGGEVISLWKEGIMAGIFLPELHGREHIAVQFWLKELEKGNRDLLQAFDHEVVSIEIPGVVPLLQGFRPEFYFEIEKQKPFLENAIIEGAELFNDIFEYKPQVFVPSDGIFHPDFESALASSGLKYLNVNHLNLVPDGRGLSRYRFCITGHMRRNGLRYYIRNSAFEPAADNYRGIDLTLKQVAAALRWRKPAVISTHRVNFIGGISEENRNNGLRELRKLLKAIVHKWPDIEFMGSAEALNHMAGAN
jgi:hypothetical protein